MKNSFGDRKTATITTIQAMRATHGPGSDHETICDKAIDYSLSEKRTDIDEAFHVRAVVRNARFAHFRGVKRGREGMSILEAHENMPVGGVHASPSARDDNRKMCAAAPSAEACFLGEHSDFCECVLSIARKQGSATVAFVQNLMLGDTVAEAAASAGLSRATAYRFVARLRTEVAMPAAFGGAA